MATKESGLLTILSSNTSYDPDRPAYDQQKLRLFYLQNGYADFRVISAVAELTSISRTSSSPTSSRKASAINSATST
jgi:outer membrane protein assembly factor BamA